MSQAGLRTWYEDNVAWISFDDPATLNAVTPDRALAVVDALEDAARTARCVVLTGEGRAFSSGASLTTPPATPDGERPDIGATLEQAYNPMMRALRDHPTPVITCVNGAAAGVAASIALAGDLILASDTAYFLQAFVNIGLVPDGGASFLLPQAVGRARAMELVLLGERLPAAKALEWGLINRMVTGDQLRAETSALAKRLATGPTRALGLTRRLIWQSQSQAFDTLLDAERHAQREAGYTADFIEGVSAFLSKRKADFRGE